MRKSIIEYIWIGGRNELRSKARVLAKAPDKLEDIPKWNYDGSSTYQANTENSEATLIPRAIYQDPFRGSGHFMAVCDTYKLDGSPMANNHRHWAASIFDTLPEEEPWYGLEQEYFMMKRSGTSSSNVPLGFPEQGNPNPQGQYYCAVGAENIFGREIVEDHLNICLKAGLEIGGINGEVAPGQWEYQIGPAVGISAGDELWLSRYLLQRVAEKYDVCIDFEPKPVKGDWNGSGCHANFSTKSMREGVAGRTGYQIIEDCMPKLEKNHMYHMGKYGSGNEERMTGAHETAKFDEFSWGVANRASSVRIQKSTFENQKGFFEDRRPSSNMDPYLVTGALFETCILN